MQPLKYAIAGLALATTIAASEPASATAVTYDVSGTFENLSGSDYSALSRGSFTGTFIAPNNTFPLAPSTYDYLHNFQINLCTANGNLFSTLSSSTSGSYLEISDNYLEPIQEEWIHEQRVGLVSRLSMMRIIARRTKAATVVA